MTEDPIRLAVARTLREVAQGWSSWDPEELQSVADQVERDDGEWLGCPVCEEAQCDDGCPLEACRINMYWRTSW